MGQRSNVGIVITARAPRVDGTGNLRGTEVWSARTVDGLWEMHREEIPGTPWVVLRTSDGRRCGTYASLPACQKAIGNGVVAFHAARCACCEGSGHSYEWRSGAEHARGFVAYERRDGVVFYQHISGPCVACGGTGREPSQTAA